MGERRHYATLAIKFGHPDGMNPEAIEECYRIGDPSSPLSITLEDPRKKRNLDFQLALLEREAEAALAAGDPDKIERAAIGKHACEALQLLANLKVLISQGALRSAVLEALFLGIEWEQMRTRRFERNVIHSTKSRRGAQKASETRTAEKEERQQAIRTAVSDRLKTHPRDSLTYARKIVASEMDVSVDTVRRATAGLKPPKKMKK